MQPSSPRDQLVISRKISYFYLKILSFVWLHPCLNPVLYSFSGVRFREKMAQSFKILALGKSVQVDSFDSKEPVTASQSGSDIRKNI